MGQVLDTVPNHMGVGTNDNAWWNDVLENGPASRYASYFDIAWRSSPRPELRDKVLLPVLGDPYGDVLEAGQLTLAFDDGAFFDPLLRPPLPVRPASYDQILAHRLEELERDPGAGRPASIEYQSILTRSGTCPAGGDRARQGRGAPARKGGDQAPAGRAGRRERAGARVHRAERGLFNGRPGDPRQLRPAWTTCSRPVLPPGVLAGRAPTRSITGGSSTSTTWPRWHGARGRLRGRARLVLRLVAEGKVDGLRIDHPDGLYDPASTSAGSRSTCLWRMPAGPSRPTPALEAADWADAGRLAPRSHRRSAARADGGPLAPAALRRRREDPGTRRGAGRTWPVHGTSGYDFLNQVSGLFVDGDHARCLHPDLQRLHVSDDSRFSELVYRKKLLIMQVSLASELHMLTYQLDRLARRVAALAGLHVQHACGMRCGK